MPDVGGGSYAEGTSAVPLVTWKTCPPRPRYCTVVRDVPFRMPKYGVVSTSTGWRVTTVDVLTSVMSSASAAMPEPNE